MSTKILSQDEVDQVLGLKTVKHPVCAGHAPTGKLFRIMAEVAEEMHRAEKLHPVWPSDLIHAAAIVSEEAGELVRAANSFEHGRVEGAIAFRLKKEIRVEAIHTATTAIRLLMNWEETDD